MAQAGLDGTVFGIQSEGGLRPTTKNGVAESKIERHKRG
jgi:hypothetical protein